MKNILKDFKRKYKKVLVTGGAGFIGSHLCEELVKEGVTVISIDDYSAGKAKNLDHLRHYNNFKDIKIDITNQVDLESTIDGVDIIFNNAASKKNICLINPRRDLLVNGTGTYNLLELAMKHKIKKFVHASTGSVYGEPIEFPQDENHPLSPVSYYGVSKLAGERYVGVFNKVFGLDTTILRYFHVFGPRQESNEYGGVVSIFIRNLLEGKAPVIFGDGSQERSFTYVKDIVKANLLVSLNEESTGECYNCASGITVTVLELAEAVINYFGKNSSLKPIFEDWLVGDIKHFQVKNEKIAGIGMRFNTDFFNLLEQTIEEMKGYLILPENSSRC